MEELHPEHPPENKKLVLTKYPATEFNFFLWKKKWEDADMTDMFEDMRNSGVDMAMYPEKQVGNLRFVIEPAQ